MKEIEKKRLEPSDIVVVGDWAYRVDVPVKGRPCSEQCHLFSVGNGRCPGFCWRWGNPDEIVFRRLLPEELLAHDAPVCVTPTWRLYEERLEAERINKEEGRAAGSRGPMPGHGGRRPEGCVSSTMLDGRVRHQAFLQHNGKKYTKSSYDRATVEKWLADIKKELGITEKK